MQVAQGESHKTPISMEKKSIYSDSRLQRYWVYKETKRDARGKN